jgi:cysteine desulfurase
MEGRHPVRPVYLDNNATTRTDPAVVDAMVPYFAEQFGNASSTQTHRRPTRSVLKWQAP